MAQPQPGLDEAFPLSSEVSHASLQDLIESYKGGLIEVPVDMIDHDEVPVDRWHVAELADSMKDQAEADGNSHGQLAPILLVEVIGRGKLAIADGFHRDGALTINRSPVALATLRLKHTEEELGDLRIVTANSHKGVSFARQIEWIENLWARTPWVTGDLTAARAFALVAGKIDASKLNVAREQIPDIAAWAEDKCKKWNVPLQELQENLAAAQGVDPNLVKEVRVHGPGLEVSALTPRHIMLLGTHLPYDYQWQNLAAETIRDKKLTVADTRRLVRSIAETHDFAEATAKARSTDWHQKPIAKVTPHKSVPPVPKPQPAPIIIDQARPRQTAEPGLAHRFAILELSCARLALDASFLRGTFLPSRHGERQLANWTVPRSDDPEVSGLVAPTDASNFLLAVYDHFGRTTDRLIDTLQSRHKLAEPEAENVLERVSGRIVDEINKGDLRFVAFEEADDFAIRRLVITSLRDELARSKNVRLMSTETERLEPANFSLANIVRQLPGMPDRIRRTVVMSGLLGLSMQTTARLLHARQAEIPNYLAEGAATISSGTLQRQ